MRRGLISFSFFAIATFTFTQSLRAERLHEAATQTFQEGAWKFKGHIEFTASEFENHQRGLSTLISTTNQMTENDRQIEMAWLKSCGVGVMFGYLSPYSKLSSRQRQTFIDKQATCSAPPAVADVKVTSCEIFTNRFLAKGFSAIGQAAAYKRIDQFLNDNDRDGLALVYALRKLGWKSLYWNTDVNTTPPLPSDRTIVGLTPADFRADTQVALRDRSYYGVPIDGYLINFAPNPGSKTKKDESILKRLDQVPYFVGISHAGFHVWSGSFGVVTESHSFFDPDSARNIDVGLFRPPYASPTGREGVDQGKKQMFYYYAGIIAVPPGPWLWF